MIQLPAILIQLLMCKPRKQNETWITSGSVAEPEVSIINQQHTSTYDQNFFLRNHIAFFFLIQCGWQNCVPRFGPAPRTSGLGPGRGPVQDLGPGPRLGPRLGFRAWALAWAIPHTSGFLLQSQMWLFWNLKMGHFEIRKNPFWL